jgi:hypothetical protein
VWVLKTASQLDILDCVTARALGVARWTLTPLAGTALEAIDTTSQDARRGHGHAQFRQLYCPSFACKVPLLSRTWPRGVRKVSRRAAL